MVQPSIPARFANEVTRRTIMTWKGTKRIFKNKGADDMYTRTIKILNTRTNKYIESRMILDTGCHEHNLISRELVDQYELWDYISSNEQLIGTCLNGNDLSSMGTVELQWKGKGFRKIFHTTFRIVDGDALPWEVILGGKTIQEHGILKFAGFGCRVTRRKDIKEEIYNNDGQKKKQEKQVKSKYTRGTEECKAQEEKRLKEAKKVTGSQMRDAKKESKQ